MTSKSSSQYSNHTDVVDTRPTGDFHSQVALGRCTTATQLNKFAYNEDVDVGEEIVATFGGAFAPLLTASTLSVVSNDAEDGAGENGAIEVVIIGVDTNYDTAIEFITLHFLGQTLLT